MSAHCNQFTEEATGVVSPGMRHDAAARLSRESVVMCAGVLASHWIFADGNAKL
jgi:hypothetical protein